MGASVKGVPEEKLMAGEKLNSITVAGTFDVMHKGHWFLLVEAFKVAEIVHIGVTTDRFASSMKKPHYIDPYEDRVVTVRDFLKSKKLLSRSRFFPLDDPFGPAIENGNLEGILVSEETEAAAEEINRTRVKNGMKPLLIFVMKMVLADDGEPISSTRVRKQEVDRYGHLIG
jgi:cytidyltransferase-like protein